MIAAMSASSRSLTLATVLAISGSLLAAPGCIFVSDDDDDGGGSDSSVTVYNDSLDPEIFIDEIYIAPVGTTDYGPNEAPGGGLGPGESIEFFVECDFYDVLLVDNFDVECEVFDLDLCGIVDAEISFTESDCSVINANGDTVKTGKRKLPAGTPDAAAKPDAAKNAPADVL
jgi:hypothetical protein